MGLSELHTKIWEFEASLSPKTRQNSHCQLGCSRCCYVDLSVFEIEADFIRQWFYQLQPSQKQKLQEEWNRPSNRTLNFYDEESEACPFLVNESCSIYPARPVICRTQGLPLAFTNAAESMLDICPLNESMLGELGTKDILNLDLLNLILARLEQADSEGSNRSRVSLRDLRQEFLADA
jgi:Fe-S-cluster containining protein